MKEFYEKMVEFCETKMRVAETTEQLEYWFKEKENYLKALERFKNDR